MHRVRHFSSGWVAMDVESTVTDMDPDSSQQTVDRHIETIGMGKSGLPWTLRVL